MIRWFCGAGPGCAPAPPAPRVQGQGELALRTWSLSQSEKDDDKASRSSAVLEGDRSDVLSLDLAPDGHRGLIQPKKVPNPMRESRSHRDLHRELLFSHSRGILPRHRAELPRVLESLRLRQLREELRGPPSDLEQQLRKRHQRLEEHEREVAGPEPDPRPEFLLVRDSLRKMKLEEAGARQT
ncbi:protein FAM107B-like [Corvus hawaiiensis]|uniref:protein FAM107B-like n=1 Tax=Corvus hawaiiensis TaxID=134902 RepID=UPI002018C6AD|nr:protein FAM107B-like [Corvus hawaiiensis]